MKTYTKDEVIDLFDELTTIPLEVTLDDFLKSKGLVRDNDEIINNSKKQ
jgi:hypothetical protein